MPTVSVIIPTFNRPELLRKALDSVLNQTFKDLEVIVIDDGSSERSRVRNIKVSQEDTRVRYAYWKNRGVAAARNKGIRMALGRYIAFLDDDDVWLPQKLERQLQFMSSLQTLGAVCCDHGFIDRNGEELKVFNRMRDRFVSKKKSFKPFFTGQPWYQVECGAIYADALLAGELGLTSTGIVARKILENVGLFDETLPTHEDADLTIRIARSAFLGFLDEVLANSRWHSGQRLTDNTARMQAGWFVYIDKVDREAPVRFRPILHANAYRLYSPIINDHLSRGNFSAAAPIILKFAQRHGFLSLLQIIGALALSSPLTAVESFLPPANEMTPRSAVRLAIRQSIRIALRYHEFSADKRRLRKMPRES